jgi:hypothetical protein
MYSTDNDAEAFFWPDGGTTMFRGEKNPLAGSDPARHGGHRGLHAMRHIHYPIGRHLRPTVKEDLRNARQVRDKTFKVLSRGYEPLPAFKGYGE